MIINKYICYNYITFIFINNFLWQKKGRKVEKILNLEVGNIKHAFRNEMSQLIHWTSIFAFAFIVWFQISNLWKVIS